MIDGRVNNSISFEKLTEDRKREILLIWFIQQEKESDELRHELVTQEESALKSERLGDALADFGSFNSLQEELARPYLHFEAFSFAFRQRTSSLLRYSHFEIFAYLP